jgi:NAD(P)-dependent dehydrogenase (short-subunit alcohol dehydrogenase family)
MIYASIMSIDGRTALVTGGARGIGRAIAERLAAAGARVVVGGRSAPSVEEAARAVGGVPAVFDVKDRAAIARAVDALRSTVGPVSILVNNAGVAESAPLARTTDAMWDDAFAVNVTAPFTLARALVPDMIAAGFGRVVNVASNAGLTGYAYTAAYASSKHALVGLTRALALELAKTKVTVNAVCPGWVDTDMTKDALARIARTTGKSEAEARATLEAMSPQRRLMRADEVAHAVLFFCSEEASGITGQALPLDGGQVMK